MLIMNKVLIISIILFSLLFINWVEAAQFNKVMTKGGSWSFLNININPQVGLYTENGYSLGSEVCKGEKFKLQSGSPVGDWAVLGGWEGHPPIVWVENLGNVIEKVKDVPNRTIPNTDIYDGYVDNVTGIPVYRVATIVNNTYNQNWELIYGTQKWTLYYGSLVCESPKVGLNMSGAENLSFFGVQIPGTFVVTSNDNVNLSYKISFDCVFYVFCEMYEKDSVIINPVDFSRTYLRKGDCDTTIREIGDLTFARYKAYPRDYNYTLNKTLGLVSENMFLKVVTKSIQPEIDIEPIITTNQLTTGSSTYLKMKVSNIGYKEITVKDIDFSVDSQFLTCISTKLSPGNSTECILSLSPEKSGTIEAHVHYQYIKCGERQNVKRDFVIGDVLVKPVECSKDGGCPKSNICCESVCHDSDKGTCTDVNADGVNEWVPVS